VYRSGGAPPFPPLRVRCPFAEWTIRRPWCTAPLGAAGALEELRGSRQSPAPWLVEAHPEPGRLPSPPVFLSDGSKRYCAPLRHPALLPPKVGSEGRDPSQRWASRVALCPVPTCHAHYPGERFRGHRSVAPTESFGLPCPACRSALTTSLSRLARASHALQPVGLQTHPQWANVPRASAIRSPSSPPR